MEMWRDSWRKIQIYTFLCLLLTFMNKISANDAANSTTYNDFIGLNPFFQNVFEEEVRTERVVQNPTHNIYTNTKLIVNRPGENNVSQGSNKEVSDTDMYLLNAIEKLAYRMDAMEKRLRRTEELIYHVMEGSNIKRQDPCPANFTRVARNCYHFSERQYNWKSAASMCKSLGSNLIEIESKDEFMEVVTYIQATGHLRGIEYWTGGLNPGLLWIWSNSARPVLPKKPSDRPGETVIGTGRCLNLAINSAKLYQYRGTDCARRINYICEHEENSTIRALIRLHKAVVDTDT